MIGPAHSVLGFTKLQIGNPICKARNTSTTKEKTNTSYLVDGFAASATIVFGIDGHNKSMPARRSQQPTTIGRLIRWNGEDLLATSLVGPIGSAKETPYLLSERRVGGDQKPKLSARWVSVGPRPDLAWSRSSGEPPAGVLKMKGATK